MNWRAALDAIGRALRPAPAVAGAAQAPAAPVAPAPPPPAQALPMAVAGGLSDETLVAAIRAASSLSASEALAWVAPLRAAWSRYGIADRMEVAHFLGQTAHESGGFRQLDEVMRYRDAARLLRLFPSRFRTIEEARAFVWDPTDDDREDVALANAVYGGRLGNERNGTEDSDGWNLRGGGLIHLTGFDNFEHFRRAIGLRSVEEAAAYVRKPEGAALSAAWYWSVNGCGRPARGGLSDEAIDAVSRRINPPLAGRDDRRERTRAAARAIGVR